MRSLGLCVAGGLVFVLGCGDDTTGASGGGSSSSGGATATVGPTSAGPTTDLTGGETTGSAGSSSGGADTTGSPTSSGADTSSGDPAGSSSGDASSSGSGEGSSSTGEAIDTCQPYPLDIDADPTAEAAAIAALAVASPGASLTWDPERGTLSSVFNVDLPFAMCPDGVDAMDFAWDVVEAHPEIFAVDRDEWGPSTNIPCNIINEGSDRTVTISRATLGGQPVLRDTFVFRLRRIDGVVHVRSVVATYLPESTPELTTLMSRCDDLDQPAAGGVLEATALPYTVFNQCVGQGVGSYTPADDDIVEWDDDGSWGWGDLPGEDAVRMTRQWSGRVIVDEANYTDELLSSDATCPDEAGTGVVVGFRVTFDSVTGEFVGSMPGIGCLVC